MLILPPGHGRSLAAPRRALRAPEKWMIASVLGLLAIGATALVIALGSAGRSSSNGCVEISVPAPTGGSELYRCGARARALCSSARAFSGANATVAQAVVRECRKAGLPVS